MKNELKIWNGRGWGSRRYDKDGQYIPDPTGKIYCDHLYVCANSRSHAIKLINQAVGHEVVNQNEAKVYWSPNCWGNSMNGITQEIGVWTTQSWTDKPIKII